MARHKIAPTERAPELTDAMRRASNKLSPPTAETLFGDQSKSSKPGKSAGKATLPTPRGSQDRATSEPVNAKRKAVTAKASGGRTTTATTDGNSDNKVHTSTPPASLVDTPDDVADPIDAPITRSAKRQKTAEPTPPSRRSTRVTKLVRDDTPSSTSSSRSTGPTKRTFNQRSPTSDFINNDLAATLAGQDDPGARAAPAGPASVTDAPVSSASLPSPNSATSNARAATDTNLAQNETLLPTRNAVSLPPAVAVPEYTSQVPPDPQAPQVDTPVHRNLHTGRQVLPAQHMELYEPNPYLRTLAPEDCVVDPKVGLLVPVQDARTPMMSQMMMLPNDYGYLPPPHAVNGGPVELTHSSTKGQKVKGRPKPKNSKVMATPNADTQHGNVDASGAISRPVANANTYPRKQPFKSQVDFPGFPPATQPIPDEYTLWDICQRLPNSLREQNLKDFVQHDWSANELCACLQDEARQILNNRQGKDKTMVFQKRLERFKKDLVAKGEYVALMAAPKTRLDGRPAWVKRGNVRRK